MATTTTAAPRVAELRREILKALAQVRAKALAELNSEFDGMGGDLELDSREAEAVIAMLEAKYGRELAKVEDLEPESLPSVSTLADLIRRRWDTGRPLTVGGTR